MTATLFRVRDAAALLGISDDTVRRLIEHGDLPSARDDAGRIVIDGVALAAYARERASTPPDVLAGETSARNRFVGLVTAVTCDKVMAEVELQCGPFTVVSLMSARSVERLGLTPGALAVAVVKATTVIVDTPEPATVRITPTGGGGEA